MIDRSDMNSDLFVLNLCCDWHLVAPVALLFVSKLTLTWTYLFPNRLFDKYIVYNNKDNIDLFF